MEFANYRIMVYAAFLYCGILSISPFWFEGSMTTILVGSVSIQAAVAFHILNIANTIRGNIVFEDVGSPHDEYANEIAETGLRLLIGAGGILGVALLSKGFLNPLGDLNFCETFGISAVLALIYFTLFFGPVLRHEDHHKWFSDLR